MTMLGERFDDGQTLWLVRWTPNQTVRVRALAGALRCVLGEDTLLSQCLSQPRRHNNENIIFL